MAEVVQHRHGKARVRVGRVWREGTRHAFVEWSVSVLLSSRCDPAFTVGDNSSIVATDSIKNTVYVKAKECTAIISMEEFAIFLGEHFVKTYPQVTGAQINIIEIPWEPITINGEIHNHGFKLGKGSHTCEVTIDAYGSAIVLSGLEGLALLKTTQSGFEGFVRDKFTLLPEVRERILATEVRAVWRYRSKPSCYNKAFETVRNKLMDVFFGPPVSGVYSPSVQNTLYLMGERVMQRLPEIESIKLSMPNLHFIPVNMPTVGVKFDHDVYLPTDEPHGTIEASLTRKSGHSKL
ncbi:hypothetical protein GOP47_0015805 [Adiantum capillus-veneris]|uniref:Uricase n=1 Tax=Adiantum capillus-veneris TaxID=13818 RepID=A0A9D4ZBZ3_ADICA|nr:hypothetical protein GOP47_0015805 [Adiantum capillus-veneris]